MEEWFRDPGNMIIAMFAALFLMGLARLSRIIAWFQRLQARVLSPVQMVLSWSSPQQRIAQAAYVPAPLPPPIPAIVPGAAPALLHPPGIAASIAYMHSTSPNDRYLLPLGWQSTYQPEPDLVHTALVGETNHVLISGASDCGKDNLAWWMLLSLALVHRDPQELQIAIIDGKGLDFQPWHAKSHTWALATDPEEIPAILRKLTAERQRRKQILANAGVSKWDHYQGGDLPLLVVFISELSLLETALKRERTRRDRDRTLDVDLESWLNTELTAGRAFGIRYLIAMQSVSGMDMLWRSQIGVFLGGYQPDESQVKPNTSRTPKQLAAGGAVPPNLLPPPPTGAGVFTIVSGDQYATTRAPYLSDTERRNLIAHLPDQPVDQTALLATLFADAVPGAVMPQAHASAPQPNAQTSHHPEPDSTSGTTALEADADADSSPIPFSARELVVIGARIARGETKTEVVKAMPGYTARRHRTFVTYYEMLYRACAEQGVLNAPVSATLPQAVQNGMEQRM
jgi:hypothetical protein